MSRVLKFAGASPRPLRCRPLLAGLSLMLSSLFPVAAETLNFNVIANVVSSSCSVVTEDLNQTITMPDIDASKLEASGQSDITFFNIRLEKCTATTGATIKFSSQFADNGWLYPLGGQNWGYMLGFTSEQGVPIPLELEKKLPLNGANNTLKFGVVAMKSSGNLHMGDFTAIATATISYQ